MSGSNDLHQGRLGSSETVPKTPSPDTQLVLGAFKISPNRALAQAEVAILIDLARKKIDSAFNWLTIEGYIYECPAERHTLLPSELQAKGAVEAMTVSRYRLTP